MYKPFAEDILAETKQTYIKAQLVSMVVSILLIILTCIFSKTKEVLLKILKVIAILSSIAIVAFSGVKINLDAKYTDSKITELYKIKVDKEENENANQNIAGKEIMKSNEDLVDNLAIKENISAYRVFKIKTMLNIILYICIVIFNIYLIKKITNRQDKQEQIKKDDNILYDEEENVKY